MPDLFWYIIFLILVIFLFSFVKIELNIIFGLLIGILFIVYLTYQTNQQNIKESNERKNIEDIKNEEIDNIIPHPKLALKYDDILDFLFSIQDFYFFNPNSYIDMIDHIDNFFEYFEEVQLNNKLAGLNYQLMEDQKRQALNALQSIIYNFPTDPEYTNKFNQSLNMLSNILDNYLKQIEDQNRKNIFNNGVNIDTKFVSQGPKARNEFDGDQDVNENQKYTYELF